MKTLFNELLGNTLKEIVKTEVTILEKPTIAPKSKEYPKIVQEIHREFDIAGDKLIEEANLILGNTPKLNENKVELLKKLGFTQTEELQTAEKIRKQVEFTKQQLEAVNYYRQNYPFNKFITEEQVETICKKYGLICGDVSIYKGFVPEKNLREIAEFKLKPEDAQYYKTYWGAMHYSTYKISYDEFQRTKLNSEGGYFSHYHYSSSIGEFKICAPLKDMNTSNMTITNGYKLEHVPDPIVLQPVNHGYLICSAWGDEASDELVVNEIFN